MIRAFLILILLGAAAYAVTERALERLTPSPVERTPDPWERHREGTGEPLIPMGPRKL